MRTAVGIALGLLAASGLGPPANETAGGIAPAHGPLLSDADGALRELVVHYLPEAAPILETAYRDFLGQLPGDVTVHVVCPDEAAFRDLRARVGRVACRLAPVPTGHPMTAWARDRWLALAPRAAGRETVLLTPRAEDGEALWPARQGDARVAADLVRRHPDEIVRHRSDLLFDGGDFVADAETVFVAPRVVVRNVGRTVGSREALRERLRIRFGRRVVLLEDAPDHHAGMYLMLAGGRRALVADPSLAAGRLGPAPPPPFPAADFSEATRARFDAVARRCAAEGYEVARIPVVPGRDGRTYLTWVNAILDERPEGRTAYMPVFRQADALNRAAEAVWRGLGYRVRRVDCSRPYVHFGSLRCLVNVLRRQHTP